MDARQVGMALVGLGVVAIVVGLMVGAGWLHWFGRLPGDIRIESGDARFYFPITSMIIVSVFLTVAANLAKKWL